MFGDQCMCDRQAKPRASSSLWSAELLKLTENPVQILFFDPAAVIGDAASYPLIVGRQAHGNFAVGGREPDGVEYQIRDHLLDAVSIRFHAQHAVRALYFERYAILFRDG